MKQDERAVDCQLWLALPAALEQEAVDMLLAGDWLVAELVALPGETPLSLAAPLTAMERVRGRTRRSLLMLLTRREEVKPMLLQLEASLNDAPVAWWTSPLLECGRLGGERP